MQRFIELHSVLLVYLWLLVPLLAACALALWWRMRRLAAELKKAGQAAVAAQSVLHTREAAWRSADRTKDDFVAMLGHELRNPLATLAAAAHVLRKVTPRHGPADQASGVVLRQIEQMTRLVEDLLDISRLARGKMSLLRQPLDLVEAVRITLHELHAAGRLEAHTVEGDFSPAWVHADEARIRQIVANLVGNAVKYTPQGGAIAVSVRRDRNTVQLRVRDNGIGMTPDMTARAFDLFTQGESAGEHDAGGLGIGLALVKRLTELHGGNAFAASSGPGQGSVFTVTLPAIEARHADEPAPCAPQALQKHRILLIDDNAAMRDALQTALELEGHRVYAAADASAGLEQAAAAAPDVALIDIRLPDLTGYQVAEALRRKRDADGTRMVLVALTGYGQADSPRRAQEAGFDQFVTKPIAPDRLLRLIDAALLQKLRP